MFIKKAQDMLLYWHVSTKYADCALYKCNVHSFNQTNPQCQALGGDQLCETTQLTINAK